MRKRKRQAVKKLIQCAAVIAAGVLAIILFMLAIWYRGKNSEPVTDEQVAAQMQQAEQGAHIAQDQKHRLAKEHGPRQHRREIQAVDARMIASKFHSVRAPSCRI